MAAKIPLFRELSAQAVLIIVFFKKKCRLVGETGLKLLDLFEVKFHFHLVKHKMPYVAVGMDLAPTQKNFSSHVTFLIFLQLIWQNDPDMRDQRESEFMEMLARCERTLFKVCLFYTDRQPDNVRDMYKDIVCNFWQTWPTFRHESNENMCETETIFICLCIFVIYVHLRLSFCQMGVWSQASIPQTINTFNHRYRNGKIKK